MDLKTDSAAADRAAFKRVFEPLVVADGRTFDVLEWLAYFEALRDIPLHLLAQTVATMMREQRQYRFRTGDVRAAAERVRLALMAAHPYQPCDGCRESRGFVETVDDKGVTRLARCGCFQAHQQAIAELGVPVRPLAQLTDGVELVEESFA